MSNHRLCYKAFTAAALCLGTFAATPMAASITQINSPITVKARTGWTITTNYNGFVNEKLVGALKAQTIFTLKSVSLDKKTWVFDLTTLKNNTVAPVNSRVSIYGFDIDAYSDVGNSIARTGTTTTSTIFSRVDSGNVPQIGPLLDVCFRAGGGGNGCSSGGGGGVFPTTSAPVVTPTFTMSFASAVNRLTFNNFFVRYQAINGGGFNDASAVGIVETVSFVDPLPEPGVWVQMIIGFGLIGAAHRRQKRAFTA